MPAPSLSRAIRKLRPTPAPPTITHPFDAYRDPDAPVQQDGVEVRTLTADQAARYGRELSPEQREGFRAELAVRAQQAAQR